MDAPPRTPLLINFCPQQKALWEMGYSSFDDQLKFACRAFDVIDKLEAYLSVGMPIEDYIFRQVQIYEFKYGLLSLEDQKTVSSPHLVDRYLRSSFQSLGEGDLVKDESGDAQLYSKDGKLWIKSI